jgi:hypothetical protein
VNLNGRSTLAAGVPRIPLVVRVEGPAPAVAPEQGTAPVPPPLPPAADAAAAMAVHQAAVTDADDADTPASGEDDELPDWAAAPDRPEPVVDEDPEPSGTPQTGWRSPPPAPGAPGQEEPPSSAWAGLVGRASHDGGPFPPAAPPPPPGDVPWTWDVPQSEPPGADVPDPVLRDGDAPPPVSQVPWTLSPRQQDRQSPRDAGGDGGDWADPDEDLWAWAPRGDVVDGAASDPDLSEDAEPQHLPPPPPPFDSTQGGQRAGRFASWSSLGAAADSDAVAGPEAGAAVDPLMARPPRPPRLAPASPVSWLRDKIALRLALMRQPRDDDQGMVSGAGSPGREPAWRAAPSPDTAPPSVESAGPISATAHSWNLPTAGGERAVPVLPHPHGATTAEEMMGPADGFAALPLAEPAGSRVHLGRHTRSLARHGRVGPLAGTLPDLGKRLAAARMRTRRALARAGGWWVLAGSLAVLVLLLAVFVPLSSKPASTAVTRTPPTAPPTLLVTPRPSPPTPSATVAPTATPSSAPAGYVPPAPLTIGNGGAGWQLSSLDYGQHATYLTVVLNLNPGTQGGSGEPTVVISAPTAQTMVVTLTGVTLSSSSGTLTGSGVVTGVGVTTSGSQTALRLALAQSVTVQSAGYILPTSPGGTLIFYLNLA